MSEANGTAPTRESATFTTDTGRTYRLALRWGGMKRVDRALGGG